MQWDLAAMEAMLAQVSEVERSDCLNAMASVMPDTFHATC